MRSMKKIILLLLVAAMLITLAACDDKTKENTDSPDVSQSETENTEPVVTEPPIPQTARTRPGTTDELYSKWQSLGVVSDDRRAMPVSNSELCVMLNSLLGYDCSGVHRYYDILRQDEYYNDVMAIDAMGILTGSNGYFMPEEPVTRERAMTALVKAFGTITDEDGATSYSDDALISDWARNACLQFDKNNWFVGDSLRPQDNITQGELLWMMDKLVNDVVNGGDLSGTYYSGIMVTGGTVNISDAVVYGSVYILAGSGEVNVNITNSVITGNIYVGRGIQSGSDVMPALSVSSSSVYGIYCDFPSAVLINAKVDEMYVNEPVELSLGNDAVVSFFVADSIANVSGTGRISMAIINENATGSSFASAPDVYFDAPGCYYSGPETGFLVILGKTYLVGEGGELYKGFVMVGEDEYYFDDNGVMATGLVEIDGVEYLFGDDGVMISGFKHVNGNICYFDINGQMLTGRQIIGDYEYIFDDAGILQTGLFLFEGKNFVANADGILVLNGLAEIEGNVYAAGEDGVLLTGVVEFDDKAHWFDPETFAMVKNTVIDDMIIDENGVITNYDGGRISSGDKDLDAMLDEVIAEICTEDMTLEEKMWEVYAWTKVNIRYRSTPIDLSRGYTKELVIEHGMNTMETRRGACEHFAIVNALLFNRLGVETELIQGYRLSLNYGDWSDHSWVLATTGDGLWYHYDALFEYTNLGINRGAFAKTDAEMASHHTWESDDYHVCDGETVYTEE
ncbi:MAG: hypothetical protein E7430_01190 [Ruminococcaceae bacterium]|nr:hypothetical protein [Oscillospiraceae bacterium]